MWLWREYGTQGEADAKAKDRHIDRRREDFDCHVQHFGCSFIDARMMAFDYGASMAHIANVRTQTLFVGIPTIALRGPINTLFIRYSLMMKQNSKEQS